jgi:hypothetical protein
MVIFYNKKMNECNKKSDFDYQVLKKLYLADQKDFEQFIEHFLIATVGNENFHDLREQAKKFLKKFSEFRAANS